TVERDFVFGIWKPGAGGRIDFAAPPALLLPLREAEEEPISVPRGRPPEEPRVPAWTPSTRLQKAGVPMPAPDASVDWYLPAPFWHGPFVAVADDYERHVRTLARVLLLGINDTCGGYVETFPLDPKSPTARVGFRLYDIAGHAGAAVETTIDLRHPQAPW